MKKIYWLVLLSICFFWIIVYFNVPSAVERHELEASANLTWKRVGIDVDSEKFSFGYVPLNGTSRRSFTSHNGHPFPITVSIYTKGNISPYLFTSSNNFVLAPNETRKLNLTFVPAGTNFSEDQLPIFYSGQVIVEYFKAK